MACLDWKKISASTWRYHAIDILQNRYPKVNLMTNLLYSKFTLPDTSRQQMRTNNYLRVSHTRQVLPSQIG